MNLTVTGRNFEITDAIKNYLIKKIAKTEVRLYPNTCIHFNLFVNKNRHMAEATIKQKGLITHATDQTRNLYLTLDNVLRKVEKQLKKHRSRTQTLLVNKS
jgi:putative sigma-54 modulation protein